MFQQYVCPKGLEIDGWQYIETINFFVIWKGFNSQKATRMGRDGTKMYSSSSPIGLIPRKRVYHSLMMILEKVPEGVIAIEAKQSMKSPAGSLLASSSFLLLKGHFFDSSNPPDKPDTIDGPGSLSITPISSKIKEKRTEK